MSDFRFDGLDKLINGLERASRDKKSYDDLKYAVGKRHLENCAKTCGEEKGQLVASFKRIPWNGKKEWVLNGKHGDTIEAGTTVFYARMVEEGHRLVLRRRNRKGVPIRGKRGLKEVGFVPGTHFMLKALEKTGEDIPEIVSDFIGNLGKEAGLDVQK